MKIWRADAECGRVQVARSQAGVRQVRTQTREADGRRCACACQILCDCEPLSGTDCKTTVHATDGSTVPRSVHSSSGPQYRAARKLPRSSTR